MKSMNRSMTILAISSLLMLGSFSAQAQTGNPFGFQMMNHGQVAMSDTPEEGKCGAAKCGASKTEESKCGAAKCGSSKPAESKCGAAKCGASK
ncbi:MULTISPECIES: low-complexity protein [Thiomicrorhabdus]|uniref:Low-complexity protein n=1 Tax=Thiomicrorhabdus heinhorstiae TaxID=2748010 RepID=A0ABS0C402_9GAMM|nr:MULTISPECIES: low-complexity protein [Thiomicrorhabdus]MBF6058982.1 low-complexity protein [Thiomicrorhabdus heinhorstiae]